MSTTSDANIDRSKGPSSSSSSTAITKPISEFWRRCMTAVQQQRARCYILRRCLSMLLCWHAHRLRD
ncbi:hypothetical protein RHGRI_010378 [Rhododendron griersonianum]|uniref:Uncharacterized protein n=1 Tax=Rhododendron griersonianum TaxID=479676 RepID=A0AAV6KIX6_9ERIC|nr:hypothetical protein RHGRI_010378 [Rhododendron griersonianum]